MGKYDSIISATNSIIANCLDKYKSTSIYHYTSTKALIEILGKKTLRATHIKFLNDPTEASYIFDLYNTLLEKYRQNFDQSLFRLMEIAPNYEIINRVYITSFSKLPNSLSLWNYYGKTDGYNIEFNTDEFISKLNNINFISDRQNTKYSRVFCPVIYDQKDQEEILNKIITNMLIILNEIKNIFSTAVTKLQPQPVTPEEDSALLQIWKLLIPFFYVCKKDIHRSEEEYRLIIIPNEILEIEKYIERDGIICPYIDYQLNRELPVNKITIGPKIKEDIAELGIKKMLSSNHSKPIIIEKSGIDIRF